MHSTNTETSLNRNIILAVSIKKVTVVDHWFGTDFPTET